MLCVVVKGQNLITGECTRSKLWLVDLAGSERVAKTDVQGDRLREAQSINKSLSALGDVIAALTTKSSHVPFRNSKLTHLLQDSLGGDSKALMFVQISPSEEDVGESLCSLNFASRVRGVELGPARKQLDSSELFKFKQLAERAKQDVRAKEDVVKKLEERIQSAEFNLKVSDNSYQAKVKDKEKAISDLEAQLAAEKKTRVAAQAALKEKAAQLEKALASSSKDVRGPAERRPLVEKTIQEVPPPAADSARSTANHTSRPPERKPLQETSTPNGSPPLWKEARPSSSPVKKSGAAASPDHENVDPQRRGEEADSDSHPTFSKPPARRKVGRVPAVRASIASTYQISRNALWGQFSWDGEDDDDARRPPPLPPPPAGARRERRVSSFSRPSSAAVAGVVPTAPASALFGRKKAVHFASPVFQKEKLRGDAPPARRDAPPEAKRPSLGKCRRVSIATAARRASAQLPSRTTAAPGTASGPQRVLSGVIGRERTRPTSGFVPPIAPIRERRWNH